MSSSLYSISLQGLLLIAGCCFFLNASFGQSQTLRQSKYYFPEDGVPNNNGYIGDFCCTGRTATVLLSSGTPIGYIYFFGWEGQAFNTETGAIVSTLEVHISGGTLQDTGTRSQSGILFTSEDIRNRRTKTVQVGDLEYTGRVSLAKAATERPGYWYMSSFELHMTVGLKAGSAPVLVDEVKRKPEAYVRGRPTPPAVQKPQVTPTITVEQRQNTPAVQTIPMITHLEIFIRTGGDDLRGGNDNAFVTVLADSQALGKAADDVRAPQIPLVDRAPLNRGARWNGNSNNTQKVMFPRSIPLQQLRGVDILTNFSGGIGGDNWNVDRLRVVAVGADGFRKELYNRSGSPLVRFTAERKVFQARW